MSEYVNHSLCRDIVSRSPDFAIASRDQLDALLDKARVIHVRQYDMIWRLGDFAREVFVPEPGGLVRVGLSDADGPVATTAINYQGFLFGEVEVFAGITTRFNEAEALSSLRLVQIPGKDFAQFVASVPVFKDYWLMVSNVRHSLAMKQIYAMTRRSAHERLQRIVSLILEYAPAGEDGEVQLPFSQETLGRMAHLSRAVTNQILQDWKEAGLIAVRYQKLVVSRPAEFKDLQSGG